MATFNNRMIAAFHAKQDGNKFDIVSSPSAYDGATVTMLNEGQKWHNESSKLNKTDKPSDSRSKLHRKVVNAVTPASSKKGKPVDLVDSACRSFSKMTTTQLKAVIKMAQNELNNR